ncbi:protein of unknown function [Lishizhenia tianjinensis]|uniref:DUF4386 domain-containing protein n=1 Tax=Lishizhenia tianjinensis TaxID=477690 RepID=A0A1I6XVQ4_9FLAO|nr:DUF4386 domain-containing protein [Lishizhenia tianjinensis]SFT42246.1 protein of unknown function [Lishizhenia tianjinensis]
MKRLHFIGCTILVLISTVLLASCTLHKRVHRPGYHISNSFKGKVFSTKKKEKELVLNLDYNTDTTLQSLSQIPHDRISREYNALEKNNSSTQSRTTKKSPTLKNSVGRINSTPEKNTPKKISLNSKQPTKKSTQTEDLKTAKTKTNNARKLAIIIGLSLLLMAILAGLSVPILNKVFSPTSPLTTFTQIGVNKSSFLGSLFGWIGIFLLDLLVAWGVFKYYQKSDEGKAKISGLLRLIYSLVLGVAILQLFRSYSAGTALLAHQSLSSFFTLWNAGLIVIGIHLMVLAFLFKADTSKKWLNIALSIALFLGGLGYVLQYATYFLFPQQLIISTTIESLFIVFMILGEIGFALWMLVKGGKSVESVSREY